MIYEITGGGMKKLSSEGKNELPKGTILQLEGYNCPRYVIAQNMGIDTKWGYGAKYLTINLETIGISYHEAIHLKHISEKKDGRIQTYITEAPLMPESEVDELLKQATEKKAEFEKQQKEGQDMMQEATERGKVLISEKMPTWAKSVIVAYLETDDCDMQSDYFNTKRGKPYLLAWSKHTRDIFSEMRQAAANMDETKHLVTPSDIDQNREKQTEQNKDWWHPSDEHREKYSMGAGYYLKATHKYDTGWKVCKWKLHRYHMDEIYLAAGEDRYKIPEKSKVTTPPNGGGNGKVTVTMNTEKNGVEIRFPGKPEASILDSLKKMGFRWSKFQKMWYAKQSDTTIDFANSLI